MSAKTYVTGLAAAAVIAWTVFAFTVTGTNPAEGGTSALAAFYVSLAAGLISLLAILGYVWRVYWSRNEVRYAHLRTSLRQAFLVGGLLVALVLLQASELLTWWDILLLAAIVCLLELYLRPYDHSSKPF